MAPVLETRNLSKWFGGVKATQDVSLALEAGARRALIGPNGAGKTTLVNLLTGMLSPTGGVILLDGSDITRLKAESRVQRGLARTFQINQLFKELTVRETLSLAVNEQRRVGERMWTRFQHDREAQDAVASVARDFGLDARLDVRTAALSYGQQRLLEIALAFACKPRVILLDEPAAGVPEAERHEIIRTIAQLPRDVAILLIEHDMDLVFSFAETITVLVEGTIIANGPPDAIANDPRVRAAYLGNDADD